MKPFLPFYLTSFPAKRQLNYLKNINESRKLLTVCGCLCNVVEDARAVKIKFNFSAGKRFISTNQRKTFSKENVNIIAGAKNSICD
jgi:hypothetical protein